MRNDCSCSCDISIYVYRVVFRELLQNSDDAGATGVEIHFNTQKYLDAQSDSSKPREIALGEEKQPLPDLKTKLVHQWLFKNNGIPFRDEDWSRLKKIGTVANVKYKSRLGNADFTIL